MTTDEHAGVTTGNRWPTTRPTREEFLDGSSGLYRLSLRLTQTTTVGEQVSAEELAALAAEVRWLADDRHGIPVESRRVEGQDNSLTFAEVDRRRVPERRIEAMIERYARDNDIALQKNISLSRQSRHFDQSVFVKYRYGWDDSGEDMTRSPHNPLARSVWVGGHRGRPETMEPSRIRIKPVED